MSTTRLHVQRPRDVKFSEASSQGPRLFHQTMPGYEMTSIISLPELASDLGVAQVLVKDECSRFGLPSFKILGGSWAVHRLLSNLEGAPVLGRSFDDLVAIAARLAPLTLVTATDGNHGRGVAKMARLLGLSSVVMVPNDMVLSRRDGIAEEGAEVCIVDGDYDDAVREAARLATANESWHLVADVALSESDEVPRWVMEGYTTIFDEVAEQVSEAPTRLFIQAGVGALAAAALGYYATQNAGLESAIVEPLTAACLFESAIAGEPTSLETSQGSMMAGLNCGTPSSVAWPIISARATAFVAIDDDVCGQAMRTLADSGIVGGESGAAGLAGLIAVARRPEARKALGLHARARILTINTEGATDPENYRRVVGAAAGVVTAQKLE